MIYLLPFKYKLIGLAGLLFAVCLSVVYFFYDLRIEIPVFGIASSYLETKFFTSFKTNVSEEIILLLFIVGFSFIVFSKEQNEKNWFLNIRIKALSYALYIYLGWLVFSIIFFYGSAFVSALIINIIFPFVVYIIAFYCLKIKTYKRRKIRILQQKLFRSTH